MNQLSIEQVVANVPSYSRWRFKEFLEADNITTKLNLNSENILMVYLQYAKLYETSTISNLLVQGISVQ